MNHDGHFDKFLETVQTQGRLNVPPFPLNGLTVDQYAFDDSPVYDDLSVLTHWLESRQKSGNSRTALFYNTASLHDGNHLTGENSKLNSRENFKIRLTKLLDDLEAFFQGIEKSGRRAVVAMIPEHGAALRGDKMQIAGLREIPSPSITLVPVGIKVIGSGLQRTGRTLQVDKPTSYLAVSHIIARLLEKPPYANKTFAPSDYVTDLPVTPFVSQNEGVVMVGYKQRYYLRQDSSEWLDYTDF
jgi:cellulose synthase operon protein YhjU